MFSQTHVKPGFTERIKIFTLNCWLVFLECVTVDKDGRRNAICELLCREDYDIVFLQEVWLQRDYLEIKDRIKSIFPYSVKFFNHLFGSGLCIFSRWPLETFLLYPYNVNGWPHYVHQADWPAGKAMGYATTTTPGGFRLNLYNTHTHARYALKHEDDEVEGHRLSQALELTEFIRATAASADAVFIAGDFNLEPYTTALRLLKRSLHLKDAWLDQIAKRPVTSVDVLEQEGTTCERGDCPYSHKKWIEATGNGIRLDYLLYRPGQMMDSKSEVTVDCDVCRHEMSEVPDSNGLFYSDHSSVAAEFRITRHKSPIPEDGAPINSDDSLEDLLVDAANIIQKQMKIEHHKKIKHLVCASIVVVCFLVFGTAVPVCHAGYKFFSSVVILIGGAVVFALVWGNLVGRPCVMSGLHNCEALIDLHLRRERDEK